MTAKTSGIATSCHNICIMSVVLYRMAAGDLYRAIDMQCLINEDVGVGGTGTADIGVTVTG